MAAASAVRTILEPETVAVIGASRDEASIGGRLLRNLLTHPFKGTVYPVNPIGTGGPRGQGVRDDRRCSRSGRCRVHRGEGATRRPRSQSPAAGKACEAWS